MPNIDPIFLESRLQAAEKLGFRCCLVLHQRDIQALEDYLHDSVKYLAPLLIPNNHSNSDVSDQINALLGTDQNCIVFDASNTFHPNLLAAAAGTVVRGGVLALLPPPSTNRFSTRFNRLLEQHRDALILRNDESNSRQNTKVDWQDEQNKLVGSLIAQIHEATSTTVVQADRGRGKSALIGRALAQSNVEATLTAPQRSACKVLLKHAGSSLVQYIEPDSSNSLVCWRPAREFYKRCVVAKS